MTLRWITGLLLAGAGAGCSGAGKGPAAGAHAGTAAADTTAERARVVVAQSLPALDGGHLKATIVEVTYGPGAGSPPHNHPCPVLGYVVEGALRTQVRGGPVAVYRAGESFYEAPNSGHVVSMNASRTEPVRFLAYFTCDHDTPLSVPLVDSPAARGQ
jgi:quercetin dioxygenase-like cupin family protein